ncbi:post-transcriptional regulator [Paenibacillus sp. H1-7]|uniref:post-transcriptional regulator n=1 Tax=Paenibacillus sp. H1-7 TaxID=2282849 RepID=UPI0031F328B0
MDQDGLDKKQQQAEALTEAEKAEMPEPGEPVEYPYPEEEGETLEDDAKSEQAAAVELAAADPAETDRLGDRPGDDELFEDQLQNEDEIAPSEYAEPLSDQELNEMIEEMCNSKADEFRMIGYEHVTGREIWECVSEKYQKTGTPPLYKVVNDILSLKVTQFMNWMTMSIYKTNPFQ